MSIYSLTNKKNQYVQVKNKVNDVAYQLNESIKKLDEIINLQKTAYKIEDQNNVNNFLTELKNTETTIYNTINNTVIPNINYNINRLNNAIEDARLEESMKEKD